ncbi:N-acyl-D-glucosamine 2-epimerase [Paenibacillus sp. DMB20]|uniref:N-acyl-D-glucosamine 2-epimerase n=1 Tax=Paenibacillus sp. DMB20 TaxID=1642570 RepID=UPI000B08EC4F|nr:N-acyl-D-glucosamine 2-epimerase [Paenibacillus sp. DMB20]
MSLDRESEYNVPIIGFLFKLPPAIGVQEDQAFYGKRNASDFLGPTIQFDPGFLYYQDRSADSIADEFLQNGYRTVRYFVVNENNVNRALVDALKKRGLTVWALVLGNGSYSVEGFPPEWPSWQMELLTPVNDGYYRFSPHSAGYAEWKKKKLAHMVKNYHFDGIEVAEPYFPEWDGINSGIYGDVGPLAQAAFQEHYGHTSIPNFTDPAHPDYYLTNRALYGDWIEFRVDTVNGFLNELMNGEGGVREARKDILVATWSLAIDAGPESVEKLREIQGLDAAEMISAVRPDLHFLQTHWPDWVKPQKSLPPTYIQRYQNFVDQIRAVHPDIPLGVQADIGSRPEMVKDRAWLTLFARTALEMGFGTWTAYEYHLGKYMYEEAPKPVSIRRPGPETVMVSFQKRVEPPPSCSPGVWLCSRKRGRSPSVQTIYPWTEIWLSSGRVSCRIRSFACGSGMWPTVHPIGFTIKNSLPIG